MDIEERDKRMKEFIEKEYAGTKYICQIVSNPRRENIEKCTCDVSILSNIDADTTSINHVRVLTKISVDAATEFAKKVMASELSESKPIKESGNKAYM